MGTKELKTKDKLLALFEENKGVYFSGEEIAEKFSVSRTAVWKAVNRLRSQGYQIDAVPNKGYSLSVDTDILSTQGMGKYLRPICSKLKLHMLPMATSTNAWMRQQAEAGAPEGYAVIANAQTEGRGRQGRRFYSPADTGVYMSLLLRPGKYSPSQSVKLTTMAAVAACEAMEKVSGKSALIKWVNDIYMDGRKVSGILTEAALGLEDGSLDYVILGIGVNAYPPREGFPAEIRDLAGAVFQQPQDDGKNRLAAEFLNRFMGYYAEEESSDYAKEYQARSLAIGKEVEVLSSVGARKAKALDVDGDCRLVVQYEDGQTEALSSGEIRVRLTQQGGLT